MLRNFKLMLIVTLALAAFNAFSQASARGCAQPNTGLNVSSTIANNVPVGLCYLNTAGECLYNTAVPSNSTSWNAACPAAIAGADCCKWRGNTGAGSDGAGPGTVAQSGECCKAKPNANPAYDCSMPILNFGNPPHPQGHPQGQTAAYNRCVSVNAGASCQWSSANQDKCCAPGIPGCNTPNACPPPAVTISYPFQQLATNPAYADLYKKCKEAAGLSGNPSTYRCCVTLPKDPCKERGLQTVNASAFNLQGGVLCCNSANPKEEMVNGRKVCCEFVKADQSKNR